MDRKSLPTTCLVILTIVVVFAVLQQTKDIFAPIIAALLLAIVLTPLSDLLDRWRVPPALAALLSVALALLSILLLLLFIEPYVTEAVRKAPIIWSELRGTVDDIRGFLRGFEKMSKDVAAAIEPAAETAADAAETEKSETVTLPSLTDALIYAPQFAAQFMIFTGTLYFGLMTRNSIYNWVETTFSRFGEDELRDAGQQVARYVLTIGAINAGFGILVAIAMHLIGMPSPILWGVLAFTLNFILYLGPIVLVSALLVAGIVVFDGAASFLPAALYLAMNATESQFVTPSLIGRSLSVNPLMVFLSLVFWLWLWGPIGGIIAIPLVIWCLTVFRGMTRQTISSGTPGRLCPNCSAGITE